MKRNGIYFLLGAFTAFGLRALCDDAVRREDGRRKKERAQKAYDEEDLEMLDEDIYAEEW